MASPHGHTPVGPRLRLQHRDLAPTTVSFAPSRSYGLLTARDVHDWFLRMMREHEDFEVDTDKAGEWPMPFSSATVRRVVVE